MLSNLLQSRQSTSPELLASSLYNEGTFYSVFLKDLSKCHHEVIIESPFITTKRMITLFPVLEKLKRQKVRVIINTRDPKRHDSDYMREEAREALSKLQHLGVHVIYTDSHHRKLVVIDRKILYEGSLNVLSQNNSCEVMRRIESVQLAWEMVRFIKIDRFL